MKNLTTIPDMKKKVSSIVLARQRLKKSFPSCKNVPQRIRTRIPAATNRIVLSSNTSNDATPSNITCTSYATSPTRKNTIDSLMDTTTLGLNEIANSVLSELKKNPKRKEVVVNVRVMRKCRDKKKKCVKAKVSTLSYKFNVNQKVLQRMIHQNKSTESK